MLGVSHISDCRTELMLNSVGLGNTAAVATEGLNIGFKRFIGRLF
ncbi:MAG: hypothetical protein RMX65_019670 [Nostoc sp. DedQUE01]|nr:hypothetical protein [Nostoc sp. DedQUE11]